MTTAYWTCAAVTAIGSYVSFGYSVAGLRQAKGESRTSSLYAFARSLALLIVSTTALFQDSEEFLAAVAITMVLVQALDASVGVLIADRMKAFGPAATAAANLGVLVWMLNA